MSHTLRVKWVWGFMHSCNVGANRCYGSVLPLSCMTAKQLRICITPHHISIALTISYTSPLPSLPDLYQSPPLYHPIAVTAHYITSIWLITLHDLTLNCNTQRHPQYAAPYPALYSASVHFIVLHYTRRLLIEHNPYRTRQYDELQYLTSHYTTS